MLCSTCNVRVLVVPLASVQLHISAFCSQLSAPWQMPARQLSWNVLALPSLQVPPLLMGQTTQTPERQAHSLQGEGAGPPQSEAAWQLSVWGDVGLSSAHGKQNFPS